VIDPATSTTNYITGLTSGGAKWSGGVLAPNGKIYGIPYDSSGVLVIDPTTITTSILVDFPIHLLNIAEETKKWVGGVLAPNGKIYGVPYDSGSILEINPYTNQLSLI
jgi:hypothetical protein